jgi:hypothetical protein
MAQSFHRVLPLHPYTPTDAVDAVDVHVSTEHPGVLSLQYVVDADLSRLRIPPMRTSARADELWKHTCFEAFLRSAPGTAGYTELNVSPSSEWAMYAFDDYRQGMRPLDMPDAPLIAVEQSEGQLHVAVRVRLRTLPPVSAIALAAVIEDGDGRLSYWALRHPAGKPDFHHPDSFALQL